MVLPGTRKSAGFGNVVVVVLDEGEVVGEEDDGVASTCCTFFVPAICVSTVGHLIAADRSRWYRASQADRSG